MSAKIYQFRTPGKNFLNRFFASLTLAEQSKKWEYLSFHRRLIEGDYFTAWGLTKTSPELRDMMSDAELETLKKGLFGEMNRIEEDRNKKSKILRYR